MRQANKSLKVKVICNVSSINRSTYYTLNTERVDRDEPSYNLIKKVFESRKQKVGIRQINMLLKRDYKLVMNRKKIARIKRKYGLVTKIRKKNKALVFIRRQQEHKVAPNIVNRFFSPSQPQQIYSTDITQFNLDKGNKGYLVAFKDLGTREIIAFKMCKHPTVDFVLEALKESISKMPKDRLNQVMIHSDQGLQFTNYHYRKIIEENNIVQSMSRRGNCLDNAPIESFFGHLKDHIDLNLCKNFEELEAQVTKEINYYNNKRPQWALNKMPPTEYRRHLLES